jgi:predicted solute-binding protein
MSNKTAIEIDGQMVEIDGELLKGYRDEAFEILRKEQEAKQDFKAAMEAQAETLGIPKKLLTKYLKAAYKAKTKEARALGTLFEQLDEATEEKLEIVREG